MIQARRPNDNAAFRVMAAAAVSWLKLVCLEYFGDVGKVSFARSAQKALGASPRQNNIFGFDLTVAKSEFEMPTELGGVTSTFSFAHGRCQAR